MKRRSKAGKQETSFVTSHNSSDKSRKTDVKDDSCANVVRRDRWSETVTGKILYTDERHSRLEY